MPLPRWRWEASKLEEKKKNNQAGLYKINLKRSPRSLYHQRSDYKVTGGGGGVGNKVNSTKTLVWQLFLEGPFTMKNICSATTLYQLEPVCWSYCNLLKDSLSKVLWWILFLQYHYISSQFTPFFPNPLLFLYRYNALSQLMLISCDLWSFLVNSQQISLLMLVIRREDKGP